jgi:hypothetical protein
VGDIEEPPKNSIQFGTRTLELDRIGYELISIDGLHRREGSAGLQAAPEIRTRWDFGNRPEQIITPRGVPTS